jgi:Flp pilus assembly protein TadD
LHRLAGVCLDRSQLSDAVGYLTRAERERTNQPQVHYHLGTALLGLKQHEKAELHLRRAVALRPEDGGTVQSGTI